MKKILKLFSKVSLYKKISIVFLSLAFTLFYSIHLNYSKNKQQINLLYLNYIGNDYNFELAKLLENLSSYTLLWVNSSTSNILGKNEFDKMQNAIENQVQTIEDAKFSEDLLDIHKSDHLFATKPSVELKQIKRRWKELSQQMWKIDDEERLEKLFKIEASVSNLVIYIGALTNLINSSEINWFSLSDAIHYKLPETQVLIPRILSEYRYPTHEDRTHLLSLISRLNTNMEATRSMSERSYYQSSNPSDKNKLTLLFDRYISELVDFLTLNEKALSLEESQTALFPKLMALGMKILNTNSTLSGLIHNELENQINVKIQEQQKWNFIEMTLQALFTVLAFIILVLVFFQLKTPSSLMLDSIYSFKSGMLNTRIPIIYKDEIGHLGIILNELADRFENIHNELSFSSGKMSEATGTIAGASKEQESTAHLQEESAKKIALMVNDIARTIKEFVSTMDLISKQGKEATELAHTGKQSLKKMELEMNDMVKAAGSISTKLNILNNRAGSITGIIVTISKIAEETHRLSLNVAIQAEKILGSESTGQKGSGLLVIAREIRRLADETAKSVFHIEEMINEMMTAVNSSVIGVDKFTDKIHIGVDNMEDLKRQLTLIIEQIESQIKRFDGFNKGFQNQLLETNKINEEIKHWRYTAEKSTKSISQFQTVTGDLDEMAKSIRKTIQKMNS